MAELSCHSLIQQEDGWHDHCSCDHIAHSRRGGPGGHTWSYLILVKETEWPHFIT